MHTADKATSETTPTSPQTARRRLLGMGTAYALGTFNDNFFKQAALLLAVATASAFMQGMATALFALPFVLFSAWAGWLADRLPKKNIVVSSKLLELLAMLLGLWALLTLNWLGIIGMLFLMGLQSTLFSPALNGAIPENFPGREVPKVNALLKLATTTTILLGIALGGIVLELPSPDFVQALLPKGENAFGRLAVGLLAAGVSVVGVGAAFFIYKSPAPKGQAPFPLRGPVDSVRHAFECLASCRPLFLVLAGEAFFYGFSSFVILTLNNFGLKQLGLSMTLTSLLTVALMAGICIGSLMAGKHEASSWRRFMLPSGFGMALGLLLAAFAPLFPGTGFRLLFLLPLFAFTGVCGGFYLIPLVSFIQIRPKASEKGKTLGISNFASFFAIGLAGLAFALLGDLLSPLLLLVGVALAAFAFFFWAALFLRRLPAETLADNSQSLLALVLQALLSLRYRVSASGLEDIAPHSPDAPILFLPNHPALVDSSLVFSLLAGLRPRPLADERQMKGPLGTLASKCVGAILIPDMNKDGPQARQGVEEGITRITAAMKEGENILLYPSGRVYRSAKERLGGASGASALLEAMPEARVVLVRIAGLWGSSFSYAAGRDAPSFSKMLLRGALTLVANLLFFTPRRNVQVEFVEHPGLPRYGHKRALNAWLENFYNEAERPPMAVPRFFWQGSKPVELPAYTQPGGTLETVSVTPELREAVYACLRKVAKLPATHVLTEEMALGGDLGLDSISLMDVVLELEDTFGKNLRDMEALVTVGDCLVAVAEKKVEEAPVSPAPPAWYAPVPEKKLGLPPQANNIPEAFFALTREAPHRPLLADRSSLRTRRQVLTAAMVLAERLKTLPGKRVGIMLPAVPSVVAVWLAAQLAGKESVFFNWTLGEANLRHCIAVSGVTHILSASALLDKLGRGGLRFSALPVSWLRLESVAASLTRREKLKGFWRARFKRSLEGYSVAEVAAILFTSGSEALPKAVPLTHKNITTNMKDFVEVLQLKTDESILAMLPPFHTFGLTEGMVLPLALGLKAAFHPNPTETDALVSLIRDYKLTLLGVPPTFLEALLDKAAGTTAFQTLRYAFIGAEKCPEHVYNAFTSLCPTATFCEGYGATECSPIVCANYPGAVVLGSIGHLFPSVHAVVVREEEGQERKRAEAGETGMLLVRGESVFGGYLGEVANPFIEFEGHTWYRTGDLISMDETGRLTFRGRLKRFIKLAGEMISLPQVEGVLLEAFGGTQKEEGPVLAVEATPEELGAEMVLFTPLALELAEVNAALRAAGLSALYSIKRIVSVEAIPLLGSGKTDYRALKASLIEGG